jgi:3-hydroxybutyryl-CoA dehydrogenase
VIDPAESAVPEVAAVYGGGRMGAGIAHALLLAGSRVVIVEADRDRADDARARVVASLEESGRRGVLPVGIDEARSHLSVTTDAGAVATAGLLVEAVPEDAQLKARVLGTVAGVLSEDAVIATNTSSISIDELSAAVERPERFLGLHFFNPVPASELVEVVAGTATAGVALDAAVRYVRGLRKTPIVVRDSPGFASSRLGVALGLEAIRMVEEGVATPTDIDAAMTLGYKHPVGPLRLTDIVGLDVRLGIAEYLADRLGPRFEPPALLREMVARGELGRKAGRGFYVW